MREAALYLALDLRQVLRGRALRAAAWRVLAALALAFLMAPRAPGEDGAAVGLSATWLAWVLGALAVMGASACGAFLAGDRLDGRRAWLCTLGPPEVLRRVGALLAGAVLVLGGCLLVAALVGLLGPVLGLVPPVRHAHALAPERATGFRDARGVARPVTLGLPLALDVPGTLLLETRPRGWTPSLGEPGSLRLGWQAGAASGELDVPWRGRVQVPLEAGAREVRLSLVGGTYDLALVRGWMLGEPRSALASWLWVGWVLGLVGVALVPWSVGLSRATSAPTAAGATVILVLLAGMRGVLPELDALPAPGALQQAARSVLEAASALAPDLTGLVHCAEPCVGRALEPTVLQVLAPLAPLALCGLGLVLLPLRRGPQGDEA